MTEMREFIAAQEEGTSPLRVLRQRLAPALVEAVRNRATAASADMAFEAIEFFRDPARYEIEARRLFRELPIVACLSADLPVPGTFRTFDDAGVPILLTRAKDGEVRAFLNVCPHRAARIVQKDCGKASRFTCRFHGWTFDATGRALGIPEEHQFCGRLSEQRELIPVACAERHGLVFIRIEPGSPIDLDAHLAGIGNELAAIGLPEIAIVHRDEIHVEANWKYGLDTFFETYHLNSLHRETFKGFFSPVCVFETFGPHHRFTFAPLGINAWLNQQATEWPLDMMPLQFFLFPNTIFSVGSTSASGSTINIHQIFPSSHDHFVSKLLYGSLGPVTSEDHRKEIDRAYTTSRKALVNEDYDVAGEAHRGILSLPRGTKLPIGTQEIGVQNFHGNIRRYAEL